MSSFEKLNNTKITEEEVYEFCSGSLVNYEFLSQAFLKLEYNTREAGTIFPDILKSTRRTNNN